MLGDGGRWPRSQVFVRLTRNLMVIHVGHCNIKQS